MRLYQWQTIVIALMVSLLTSLKAQIVESVGVYAFANSLIDHALPNVPTVSNETTIFHWMNDIRLEAGKGFSAGGQFGFLINHAILPPSSGLYYDLVMPVWDQEAESFGESKINAILLTTANFIQYIPASSPYPLDESTTVVNLTETIFDWVDQEIDAKYYLYLNWPEMDLRLEYPPNTPSSIEIENYHIETIGSFTDWWIEYQDLILASRPEYNTRLIPVGSILSKLMTELIPNEVPFEEYYDDSAPHGKPTLYFLAGAITYMAMYEEKIPSTYLPSDQVHSGVRDNLSMICDFMWEELLIFNLPNGESRVFSQNPTSNIDLPQHFISIFPNPANGVYNITGVNNNYRIEVIDIIGNIVLAEAGPVSKINIVNEVMGLFFVQIKNEEGHIVSKKTIIKTY